MPKPSMAQGKQLIELFSSATEEQVQGVVENLDLVKEMLESPNLQGVDRGTFKELLCVNCNPYANEKIDPAYDYPAGFKWKSTPAQLKVLKKLYPELDVSKLEEIKVMLTPDVESLQLVPKLSAIAKLNGIEDPYGTGYGKCLEVMLSHISSSREFHNYREGRLTEKHVRLLQSTKEVLIKLETETPGDYLVIPMQSGKLYAGCSVRNARWEIDHNGQWALPAWVVGHHLLTHPKRCVKWEELDPDCAGDEYSPGADGSFGNSLFFDFHDGGLGFGYGWAGFALGGCGTASGFLRE